MSERVSCGRLHHPAGCAGFGIDLGDSSSALVVCSDTLNFQSEVIKEQCRPPSSPLSAERPSSWYVASICLEPRHGAVPYSGTEWATFRRFCNHIRVITTATTRIVPRSARKARPSIHSLPSFFSRMQARVAKPVRAQRLVVMAIVRLLRLNSQAVAISRINGP